MDLVIMLTTLAVILGFSAVFTLALARPKTAGSTAGVLRISFCRTGYQ